MVNDEEGEEERDWMRGCEGGRSEREERSRSVVESEGVRVMVVEEEERERKAMGFVVKWWR